MPTLVRCLLVVMLLLTAGVCPASAQMESPGLFRGLFGGASPVAGRQHVLDLSASAFAAYVKDIVPAGEASLPSSSFEGANATLMFQHEWKQASVGAFGNAGTSYFNDAASSGQSQWVNRWALGARAGFSRQIARRTTFSADGTLGYSPYYAFGLGGFGAGGLGQGIFSGGFASGPDRIQSIPGLDYTVAKQPTLNGTGHIGITRALSARSTLEGYYSISDVSFIGGETDGFGDQLTEVVGGRYRYAINRYVSVRAGYGYMRSMYGGNDAQPVTSHLIDAGVDGGYGHEYRIARQTTFSFDTRSSVFVADQVSGDNTFAPGTQFFLGGSAALAHRWGRTWQANARYDRSAGFVDGFRDPVFSNTSNASVRGVPLPRLDFIASVSHAVGNVGFGNNNNGFTTTTGTAQLRFALFRNLATYAQYFYYYYNFEGGVVLPGPVPSKLDRQGGSAGLTLWVPLY